MSLENFGETIKKGVFKRMAFTSSKKYFCNKGELTLASKGLLIDCESNWSRFLPFSRFQFEAWGEYLEVYELYHHKLRFRFIVDELEEWNKAIQTITVRKLKEGMKEGYEYVLRRPEELKKLFDMRPETLKKLQKDIKKERERYEEENMLFNLHVYSQAHKIKDRKLKAFIVAHSYVAWYEWLKKLLYKIYKAKFGKGPKDDNELMKFLDNYPSWKFFMDTSKWDIKPNQIRNCVSHERFYYDYSSGEIVFMAKREKRVKLFDMTYKVFPMANFYSSLINYLHNAENVIAKLKEVARIAELTR